ncbi:MAG: SPOR domain-containing protein [Alkalispirochaeta sp.]
MVGTHGIRSGRLVLVCIVAWFAVGQFPVAAQSVDTYDEAVEWLSTNRNSPQYGSMLYTAVEYAPTVEAVQDLLDEYLKDVMDRSDRGRILLRAGIIQELAHQYNRARLSYARAVDADPTLWDASLRRSALAIEEGDVSEAELLLTQVIYQAPTRQLQRRAAILRIRAYSMQEQHSRAFSHAASLVGYPGDGAEIDPPEMSRTVEPEALLLLYETARSTGNSHAEEWSRTAMETSFPHESIPEASLVRDIDDDDDETAIATFYPSPSRIFGGAEIRSVPTVERRPSEAESGDPEDDDESTRRPDREEDEAERAGRQDHTGAVTGIQTGSFQDRENAQYMVRDIRELDFSAEIQEVEVNDTTFFRVIVPLPDDATPESAQETVVKLKEQGVEGFLVFQSP